MIMKHISDEDKKALRKNEKERGGGYLFLFFFFKNCRFCFPAIIHATSFCLCLSCFRRKSHFFVAHNFVPQLKSWESQDTHVPIILRGVFLRLCFQVEAILPFHLAKQILKKKNFCWRCCCSYLWRHMWLPSETKEWFINI